MSPRNTQFGKEEIINAAFALVREQGWEGFSVQAVAKAINASTMPIYSHFANVRELEDAVCRKALELLKKSLLVDRTGDVWIDQAVSYVRFAMEEKHLYRSMWDGRNVELNREMGKELVDFISGTLVDYPLFAGLGREELTMIRLSRMMFAQKLAHWLNSDSNYLESKGIFDMEDFIRRTSKALYDGFRMQFSIGEGAR
ncbi:MAG: TetR/AcrR family transcriptional regulator [Desulfuromonadales bacterium]|nr:MAG: TetR/AcrR family transcriptional regulator [Desulfuromonadales bacterium]